MAINRIVIKDKNGNIVAQESFASIDTVKCYVTGGAGNPSVVPSYENGTLVLMFNNIQGDGIADMQQAAISTQDNGVNIWRLTTQSGETYNLEIRNGSKGNRGNGIASFVQTEQSADAGGRNTWRMTDDDGHYFDISVLNGSQGDSVLVGQGDMPLSNTVEYVDNKAITPKAVAEEVLRIDETLGKVISAHYDTDFSDGLRAVNCNTGAINSVGTSGRYANEIPIGRLTFEVLYPAATYTGDYGYAFVKSDGTYVSGAKHTDDNVIDGYVTIDREMILDALADGATKLRMSLRDGSSNKYGYDVTSLAEGKRLDEMESEIDKLDNDIYTAREEDKSDATLTDGYITSSGTFSSSGTKTAATGFIDCDGAEKIELSMIVLATAASQYLVFYSTNSASGYISRIARLKGASEGTVRRTYDVPQGAKYFRTTYWNDTNAETYGDFYCKVKYPTVNKLDKLEDDIESMSTDLESVTTDVGDCKDELFEEVKKAGSNTEAIAIQAWTNNTSISAINGKTKTGENTKCTGFLDVSEYYSLNYSRIRLSTVKTSHVGMAFYDENYAYISGQEGAYSKSKGVETAIVVVPENAKYARFTAWKDEQSYGEFFLEGTDSVTETVAKYAREIEILNRKIDSIDGKSQDMELDQMDIVELNEIAPDGSHSPNSNMGCTDYIPCYGALVIKYTRVVSTLSGAGLAFYDDDKVFISYVDNEIGDNGMTEHVVNVPQGASYFRATGWNYENSQIYGEFQAAFESSFACSNGKRASNSECTYFSVVYNSAIDNLAATDFSEPSQKENYVCTTAVVLLPDDYSMEGKPSRVIINFHGWSHYVHYKKWGARNGFLPQKQRWAAAGYAVIDINHKNSSCGAGYSGLGSRQDDECYRRAFEWVKNHYNVEDTCFIVCGSAGGPNGINACYNWPEVRCGVWLDAWVDVADHAYPDTCGKYYYGYTGSYDASKVGTRNPATRIVNIGGVNYLQMPPCPIKMYFLMGYLLPFVSIIRAGHAIGGDCIVRACSHITHEMLVSGGDGSDPEKAAKVDEEIINYLNQH